MFRYLHPNSARNRALLQSPIFETRWRWSTTLSLAVPRNRGGARVPNQLQRMYAEDLLQAVFPDAVACQDNLQGAREIPDHPLVNQALRDALEEAVDLSGLEKVLRQLVNNEIRCVARDMPEPSVLSHELLNSAVYTFLDDAPLEERRTRAVYTRRATEARSADDLGALDPAAIERVRVEAWPVANTADEMYDALMVAGFIRTSELAPHRPALLGGWAKALKRGRRLARLRAQGRRSGGDPRQPPEVLGPVTEKKPVAARARSPGSDSAGTLHAIGVQAQSGFRRKSNSGSTIKWRLSACSRASTASRLTACAPKISDR